MKRILIVAPHPDDEILGCGGYIISESQKGSEILVAYGAVGSNDNVYSISKRKNEASKIAEKLHFKTEFLYDGLDGVLSSEVAPNKVVSRIDDLIYDFRPNEFLFNYPSRHQDHIYIYNCCMASIRLKEYFMPDLVALYEYPFVLNHYDKIDGGRWYHDVSNCIEEKIKAFEMYESQVKNPPSPLNEYGIRTLAATRGLECGCKYAEMFYIQKMLR